MKSDCCGAEVYEVTDPYTNQQLFNCERCGSVCKAVEGEVEPSKLTPAQVAAIRWPSVEQLWDHDNGNAADTALWAIRYALKDLMESTDDNQLEKEK